VLTAAATSSSAASRSASPESKIAAAETHQMLKMALGEQAVGRTQTFE
jgi:hypothetical protein